MRMVMLIKGWLVDIVKIYFVFELDESICCGYGF